MRDTRPAEWNDICHAVRRCAAQIERLGPSLIDAYKFSLAEKALFDGTRLRPTIGRSFINWRDRQGIASFVRQVLMSANGTSDPLTQLEKLFSSAKAAAHQVEVETWVGLSWVDGPGIKRLRRELAAAGNTLVSARREAIKEGRILVVDPAGNLLPPSAAPNIGRGKDHLFCYKHAPRDFAGW